MCSTPGSSYHPGQSHRHTVNISSSYSPMSNNASEYYKQLQKELTERRKKLIENEKARLENTG